MELYEKVLYVNRWLNAGVNRAMRVRRSMQDKMIDLPISAIVLTTDNFVTITGYLVGMDVSMHTRISATELDAMVSYVKMRESEEQNERREAEAKEENNQEAYK